jgi:hypothetical protein
MEIKDIPKHLTSVNKRIDDLESTKQTIYETRNKYIPSMGFVAEFETKRECAKALALIKSKFFAELESAKELGLTEEEVAGDSTFLGFTYSVWKEDIQAKIEELKREEQLYKLRHAKEVLLRHRSKSDTLKANLDDIEKTLAKL